MADINFTRLGGGTNNTEVGRAVLQRVAEKYGLNKILVRSMTNGVFVEHRLLQDDTDLEIIINAMPGRFNFKNKAFLGDIVLPPEVQTWLVREGTMVMEIAGGHISMLNIQGFECGMVTITRPANVYIFGDVLARNYPDQEKLFQMILDLACEVMERHALWTPKQVKDPTKLGLQRLIDEVIKVTKRPAQQTRDLPNFNLNFVPVVEEAFDNYEMDEEVDVGTGNDQIKVKIDKELQLLPGMPKREVVKAVAENDLKEDQVSASVRAKIENGSVALLRVVSKNSIQEGVEEKNRTNRGAEIRSETIQWYEQAIINLKELESEIGRLQKDQALQEELRGKQFDFIFKHKLTQGVAMEGDYLVVCTKPIILRFTPSGFKKKVQIWNIGRWFIRIKLTEMEIRVFPADGQSRAEGTMLHPHVYHKDIDDKNFKPRKAGEPCWGNLKSDAEKAMENQEYAMLFDLLAALLTSCNPNDDVSVKALEAIGTLVGEEGPGGVVSPVTKIVRRMDY